MEHSLTTFSVDIRWAVEQQYNFKMSKSSPVLVGRTSPTSIKISKVARQQHSRNNYDIDGGIDTLHEAPT